MRILHVTPYYADAWGYGGIPRVVPLHAEALVARGHQVTVLTTDAGDEHARAAAGHTRRGGVEVVTLRNLSNRAAYAQLFLPLGARAWLARHAARFDVAHLHACRNLLGALAGRALDAARVPWVLQPHGTAPRIERRLWVKRFWDDVVERDPLARAAALIGVSAPEAAQLAELAPGARVTCVENPLHLEPVSPARSAAFRRDHGVGDRPLIVFLGKLSPRKRADLLIGAAHQLRAARPVVVVAGNDIGAGEGARQLAAELGVDARFIGLQRGGERLVALAAADVVVSPGHDEVFGLVPFEALACATPVVVSDDHGCGALVGEVGGGLTFARGSLAALTQALDTILGARAKWRAAAATAAERVHVRFAPRVAAEALEAVYQAARAR